MSPGELVADDYHMALFTMVGVLGVGFVANLLIRPVDEKHFDEDAVRAASRDESKADATMSRSGS